MTDTARDPASSPASSLAPVPRATYRFQFHKGFTFKHALALVDYLDDLGISHVYASPILTARPGSTHGYDVVEHDRLNPELGTEAELGALVEALQARGIGLLLDIVPNHMGIGRHNPLWLDLLEWGPRARHARFFDVDWTVEHCGRRDIVILPTLGKPFGQVLADGEIELKYDAETGSFAAWYFDEKFPIAPVDYAEILRADPHDHAISKLAAEFATLGEDGHDATPAEAEELHARAEALKARLVEAGYSAGAALAAYHPRGALSRERLGRLLDRQNFRLVHWRAANDEINYRRFFAINELAGLSIERPEVFEEAHAYLFSLVDRGWIQGFRIDHIDGLADPRSYLERLQARLGRPGRPFYVVVEKILGAEEALPTDWPVAGTTGYDRLNILTRLFHDPEGETRLSTLYRSFTWRLAGFDELLFEAKKRFLRQEFSSEVRRLARAFHRLACRDWNTRDFTRPQVEHAVAAAIAAFPVYRSYAENRRLPDAADRQAVETALSLARKRGAPAEAAVYDFLARVLTLDLAEDPRQDRSQVLAAVALFQQFSGPAMAKGLEDTVFFAQVPLLSLNEVGGEPQLFSISAEDFHRRTQASLKAHPHELIAGTTHDTKRGEDARARLACLTSLAEEWEHRLKHWHQLTAGLRTQVDGKPAPSLNAEYYFFQTLLGAWPAELKPDDAGGLKALGKRVGAAMLKALREAKEVTNWGDPDAAQEKALQDFCDAALDPARSAEFLNDVADFLERLGFAGALTSLSALLLRLTIPGVPDIYQGSESWELSMVDPDNRRPPDYGLARALLSGVRTIGTAADGAAATPAQLAALLNGWRNGAIKSFVLARLLRLRRRQPELFAQGDYRPLAVSGIGSSSLLAFERHWGETSVAVFAPRLWPRLLPVHPPEWPAPALSSILVTPTAGRYCNIFTGKVVELGGQPVSLSAILNGFPVAVLARLP